MKRLIFISTLLLFIFSSCDSPVTDVGRKSGQSLIKPGQVRQSAVLTHTSIAKLDSVRKDVLLRFSAGHGQGWRASWSKKGTTPTAVFGGTTKPIKASPKKAAVAFLAHNRALFNMRKGLKDLKFSQLLTSSNGVQHVRFKQTYHGIPVYEAGYQVHIRPNGRIDMANGRYYRDIKVSTSAGISAASAKRAALTNLGGPSVNLAEDIKKPELVVYRKPHNKNFALAWKVLVITNKPNAGDWQYFVNAGSGEVLHKLNLASAVTGGCSAIEDNPLLTPTPVTRSCYRLYNSGYLEGLYANVHNDKVGRAYSPTFDFQYDEDNIHFDEANAYTKVDRFRAGYLSNLGFNSDIGSDKDLEVTVHDETKNPNNAAYYPAHEGIWIGDVYPYAKSEKVIYHEFTHAVVDVVNGDHRFDPNFSEEGAISEGLADYFPGSKTGRPKILEAIPIAQTRNMENPLGINSYSQYENESPVEPHDGGEFFSSILWDLRNNTLNGNNMTHDMTDQLVYRAISRVGGRPDFIEYRDAMMAADNNLNNGNNNNFIQDTFAARGVGNFTPLGVTISGPCQLDAGQSGTWTVNASNGDGNYSYKWYRKEKSFDGSTYYHQVSTGTSYSGSPFGTTDFSLRVNVEDSNGKFGSSLKFVVVGQFDTPPPCDDGPPYHICIEQ